jgi:uncharacterized membrane protein
MDRWLRRLIVLFAAIGLLVSIYMTVFRITEDQSMCLGNGGCSVVNSSIYSEVYGVPVSFIGIVGYSAILALLAFSGRWETLHANETILGFGLALTGFLFSAYLVYVEIALIKALCPFCVTSQISMTLIFIFAILRLVREPAN